MPERINALWFFVALFGGGAGIWWVKREFPEFPWLAAAVAAAVVLGLMIYYMLNDENAPEEEGDNVYYLGLLFTLISLMFALLDLFGFEGDPGAGENTKKIPILLRNFGIALTSTIVGIAGRVAIQNWQRPGSAANGQAIPDRRSRRVWNWRRTRSARRPEFAEDTAIPMPPPAGASSQDLEQFNRHLLGRIARDLTQGANALARFHRIVRSHASDTEEHLRNHSETLKRESAAFKDMLQRDAETFARELRDKAENMLDVAGGSLDAAAKQAEALLERLRLAHDGYLAEVREITRSFHDELRSASGHSLDTLRQSFDAAARQSLLLAQNASTTHERIGETFDSLKVGFGHANDASEAFGISAQQAAKSTTVLEVEVDRLRAVLVTVHAGTEAMKGMLDAMGELDARIRTGRDMEQTAATVREIGETLRTITTQAAAATERAAEAAELFDALRQSVRTTEDETRHAVEALRALASEAETQTKILRQRQVSGWRFWKRSR